MSRRAALGLVVAALLLAGVAYLVFRDRTPPDPELPLLGGDPGLVVTSVEYRTPSGARTVKPDRYGFALPRRLTGPVVLRGTRPADGGPLAARLLKVDFTEWAETPLGDLDVRPTSPTAFQVDIPADRLEPGVYRVRLTLIESGGSALYQFNVANQ